MGVVNDWMRVDSLCGVWLNNKKRVNDLMQMLFLNEASTKLTMQLYWRIIMF